jgi:ADP-ribose pyrophosphatase
MLRDDGDLRLRWEETSRAEVLRCPFFTAYRSERVAGRVGGERQAGTFYVLDAPDWVTVVPLLKTDDGADAFLMVRQYRHGIERVTLEFPAGLVDHGEPPEAAARRELGEETGHQADSLVLAATMGAAPAFMTNWCHVYVARGLRRTGGLDLDDAERLDPVVVPAAEVLDGMGSGELVNSITAMSLYCYLRHLSREATGSR